jgi:hypothetical protein
VIQPCVTPLEVAIEREVRAGNLDAARELQARYTRSHDLSPVDFVRTSTCNCQLPTPEGSNRKLGVGAWELTHFFTAGLSRRASYSLRRSLSRSATRGFSIERRAASLSVR